MLKQLGILSALILLALPGTSATAAFPSQRCDDEDAWGSKKPNDYLFDFTKDIEPDPNGSGASIRSYDKYLDRLKTSGIPSRQDCYKDWTVLYYVAGTKDLIPWAFSELLLSLELGTEYDGSLLDKRYARASSLNTDFVVHLEKKVPSDPSRSDSTLKTEVHRIHVFQSPQVHSIDLNSSSKLTLNDIQSPTVHVLGDVPTTERQRFLEFVKWGMETYPSDRYSVVIFGHGRGYTAKHNDSITDKTEPQMQYGGIGLEEGGGGLTIPDVRDALLEVTEWNGGQPVDVLMFDACNMMSVEVACCFKGAAKEVVGSADIMSYLGLPHGSISCHLNSDKTRDGAKKHSHGNADDSQLLSWMIVELTRESLNKKSGDGNPVIELARKRITVASVDVVRMERALMADLDELGTSLLAFIDKNPSLGRILDVKDVMRFEQYEEGRRDLGMFLKALEDMLTQDVANNGATPEADDVLKKVTRTKKALNDCVINSYTGTRYQELAKKGGSGNNKSGDTSSSSISGPVTKPVSTVPNINDSGTNNNTGNVQDSFPTSSSSPAPGVNIYAARAEEPQSLTSAKGLAIFAPKFDTRYQERADDYAQDDLYKEKGWKAFMDRMYQKQH